MERDEITPDLFRPEKAVPVDPEHFTFALQLGSAAGTYRMPMKSPAEAGMTLEMPDGTVQGIGFTDVPLNRFAFAIRDHFGSDRKSFTSFMMRFFALQRLSDSKRMKKWVRKVEGEPDAVEVHQAVSVAAATLPLSAKGSFDANVFFKKVEETARAMDEEDARPRS